MGNWCVPVGMVAFWTDLPISKYNGLNLLAHMWPKDPKGKFPWLTVVSQDVSLEIGSMKV